METSEELFEKAADRLAKTAEPYEPKSTLYYAVFVNDDGDYEEEVQDDQYHSICEDCTDHAGVYYRKRCEPGGEYEGKNIELWPESSPEDDDFVTCGHCGEYIDVGVLHGFSQEIDHWTDIVTADDFARQIHFSKDAWVMHELLTNETVRTRYPEQLTKLANRILSHDN